MSYILDALKKSDQERRQGEVPSLQTVHTDRVSARQMRSFKRRKVFWALGLGCLATFAVGLWLWTTGPAPPVIDQPSPEDQPAPIAEPSIQSPPQPITQEAATRMAGPVHKTAPQRIEPLQQKISPQPQHIEDMPEVQPEVVIEPAPLSRLEQAPTPHLPKAASDAGSPLPLMKELPVDRQKAIPEIRLAGHVYADTPSRRLIMINNRIVREGEMVGENLRLVRITWDGVILRHIDTEFQMKLQ